ncbi:MAG: LamG-like jellyroll fold domain-containing protein, partial [Bacteroidota bacterium]|nr:LamG-like jellyroll fold domain-containing protein [Bacteroidota bacterium]
GTTARLYVDGTEVDNSTGAWNLATSTNNLNIAARYSGGYSNYFNGQIDEVRISDIERATSAMQLSTHEEEYTSDANTVFLMHFNDQANTPTYISGVGYAGTITSHNISSADYLVGEVESGKLLRPEYRSKTTGNWNASSSWEYDNTGAANWVDAALTPSDYDDDITILNGHTITVSADVDIDQTTIASGGQVTVSTGNTLTISNGTGTDLTIDGTLRKEGTATISYTGTFAFNSGGKFELAGTNKYIPQAIWDDNSTCEITGAIGGDMTSTYHTDQEFGNFTWNCTGQTSNVYFSGALTNIDGDFTLSNTNSYEFRLTGTAGDDPIVDIAGDVDIQGGTLNLTSGDNNCYFVCNAGYSQSVGTTLKADGAGTGYLRFGPISGSGYSGTFTNSGTFTPEDIQVNSSYTLTLGSNMNIGTAPLTVDGTFEIPATYTLTIPAGGEATATGTLTNNAGTTGLVIESNATDQGSLIQSTASVDATVERQITGHTGNDDGWHLLGSPVATFTIDGSEFNPGTNDDLYRWDESNNVWKNHKAGDPTQIIPGTGYLTAWDVTDTKDFTGVLNVSDVTHTDMTADAGKWHCLGNPFASALDWSAGTWTVTDVSVPQIYDESDGNYYAVNTLSGDAANIIPSTQGFFVEVVDATNTITLPADARVHSGQDWYKQSYTMQNTLKLKLFGGNNSFCDYTLLSFDDNATEEYDIEFDSHKLFGYYSPQMYTLSPAQEEFSYNIIPTFVNEKLIPLNIVVHSVGDYTIKVEINNVVMDGELYLEDLLTNQMTNLSVVNSYTFQASPQNAPNRFVLHFNGTTEINDLNNQENSVLIYSNNDQIYVRSMNVNMLSDAIVVRNVIGQTVYNQKLNGTSLQRISTNLNTGIYFVDIVMQNGLIVSEKVFIK